MDKEINYSEEQRDKILEYLDTLAVEELELIKKYGNDFCRMANAAKCQFHVGEVISFNHVIESKDGGKIERNVGIITKIGLVRYQVKVLIGEREGEWKVPYEMLEKPTKEELVSLSIKKMSDEQ